MSGFRTCIRNNTADSTLYGYLRDYYGNKYLWNQVLAHAPGTEGDLVSDVRRAELSALVNNAVDLLGQPQMDEMVQEFAGTSISHWLHTIQSHSGGNYHNTLVTAIISYRKGLLD